MVYMSVLRAVNVASDEMISLTLAELSSFDGAVRSENGEVGVDVNAQ